jgi:hypothetical protein
MSRCAQGFDVAQITSLKRKFRRGRERRPNAADTAAPGTRRKTFADIRAQSRALSAARVEIISPLRRD